MAAFVVLPATAFFSLGTLHALQLKQALEDKAPIQDALAEDPIPLERLVSSTTPPTQAAEYTKVVMKGHIDPTIELKLAAPMRDGAPGFFAVSPFVLSNGTRILLNRGWVARDKETDRARTHIEQTETAMVGLLKSEHKRPVRVQDNEPEANTWYWRDVATMAKTTNTQAVLVDAVDSVTDSPGNRRLGLPIPHPSTVMMDPHHRERAVRWYALSAATAGVLVVWRRRLASRHLWDIPSWAVRVWLGIV